MLPTFAPPKGEYWMWDINKVVNPYGTVEIGYDRPFGRRFDVKFDVHHISSIPVNDQGQNTAEISLRWYPWRDR